MKRLSQASILKFDFNLIMMPPAGKPQSQKIWIVPVAWKTSRTVPKVIVKKYKKVGQSVCHSTHCHPL